MSANHQVQAPSSVIPPAIQALVPPKRPVRINGRLSLPAELWPAVITASVANHYIIFDGRCPDLPGIRRAKLQDIIDGILAPFRDIPIARRQAEEDVWVMNEFTFQVSSQHQVRTSAQCWATSLQPFGDRVMRLQILVHDWDSAGWHENSLSRTSIHQGGFGTALPLFPGWVGRGFVPDSTVDPAVSLYRAVTKCPQLDKLTVQILNTPVRRGRRTSPGYRAELLSKKHEQFVTFLQNLKALMRIDCVIVAVMAADQVQGEQSIPLPQNQILKEEQGALAGLDHEGLCRALANRFYTPPGQSTTSRVAVQLA